MCGNRVVGPYFIEGNQTAETYTLFIQEVLPDLLITAGYAEEEIARIVFMQDGHPAHTSNLALNAVRLMFENRLISSRTEVEWPPRSPDLTPCDFFLWGYIKEVSTFSYIIAVIYLNISLLNLKNISGMDE